VLRDAIMCRNALIHERRSPPPAALVAALRALRDLVSSLPQGVGDH
jgi:hypothetical protein